MTILETIVNLVKLEYIEWGIYVASVILTVLILVMIFKNIKNKFDKRNNVMNCDFEFSTCDLIDEKAAKIYVLTHRQIIEEEKIINHLKNRFNFDTKKAKLFISKFY